MRNFLFALVCTVLFAATAFKAYAQKASKDFAIYMDLNANDTVYTCLQENRLRLKADSSSKTLAVIGIGEQVIIDETRLPGKIPYMGSRFYRVKYKGKAGYLHSSSIALGRCELNGNGAWLLFRIMYPDTNQRAHIALSEIQGRELASELVLPLNGSMFSVYNAGTKGLDSISCLVVLDYSAEACGEDGGITWFTYTPGRLAELAHMIEIGDADVFSYGEWLTFPADPGGVEGKIIYNSTMYEMLDEESEWHVNTKSARIYSWKNGEMLPEFKRVEWRNY